MVRSTVEAIKTTKRNASAHNIVHRVGLYANKNATETPGDRCRCVWWVCALRDDGTHINMCGILTLFVNMHYYWETPYLVVLASQSVIGIRGIGVRCWYPGGLNKVGAGTLIALYARKRHTQFNDIIWWYFHSHGVNSRLEWAERVDLVAVIVRRYWAPL